MAIGERERFVSEMDRWLIDYGDNHRDVGNAGLYWIAVPVLVIGTVGLLWALPVPDAFVRISPFLNWGTAFLMAAVVYYFIISVSLAIGMLPFMFGVAAIASWLHLSAFPHVLISACLTSGAVIGLWLGQYSNGGIRAVLSSSIVYPVIPPVLERWNQGGITGYTIDDDCAGVVVVCPLSAIGNTVLEAVRIGGPI